MSLQIFHPLKNPGHGKVGDLMGALAYPDPKVEPSTTRNYYDLRRALTTHRLDFKENTPELDLFPIDIDSPEVLRCVNEFLDKYGLQYFAWSEEAEKLGWPVHPRDQNK